MNRVTDVSFSLMMIIIAKFAKKIRLHNTFSPKSTFFTQCLPIENQWQDPLTDTAIDHFLEEQSSYKMIYIPHDPFNT